MDQVGFLHVAATFDHGDFLLQTQGFGQACILCGLADEGHAGGVQRAAEAGEHRAVVHRLWRRDRGIGVAHQAGRDGTTLENQRRLHAKKRRAPEHQIRPFAHFDRAHFMADAVGDRRVDGVLGDVAFGAEVVVACTIAG
ncbi:hypothetical protein D3C85_1274040 [compost metagenome]